MAKKPPKQDKGDAAAGATAEPAPAATPGAAPEAAQAAGPAAGKPTAMAITVNAQYIKDLSFEVPGAPGIYNALRDTQPDITVNINVNVSPMKDKTFEVVLETRSDCKVKGQTAFILELQYAGVFTLNVPEEHVQPILLIECPRILFPFARNVLADVSRDGGFPPLFLGMVDFAQMYQAKLNELQKTAAAKAPGSGSGPGGMGGSTA